MPQRLAGAMALVAFAYCLLVGGFGAENTFSTAVYRALVAMAGTFVVAYVLGLMARKMIEENVAASSPASGPASGPAAKDDAVVEISEAKTSPRDR